MPKWPGHARYGKRAGMLNEEFLDAELFKTHFALRLEPYASRISVLILEFGTFAKSTFPSPGHFIDRLDPFLGSLPEGFRYAIEIRNADYLEEGYFTLLASHNVAHVFNAWSRMPELGSQLEKPGVDTADLTVVRALLAKGRTYEQAVKDFEPYELIREPNEGARDALREIATRSRERKKPAFLYVNNRLEGFAPGTIEAVAYQIGT